MSLSSRFARLKTLWHPAANERMPLCPLPKILDLSEARRVLAFVPHPDDEAIGLGGTLALLARHAEVHVVLVTDGSGAGGLPEGAGELRQREFLASLEVLGVENHAILGEPDGGFVDRGRFRRAARALLDSVRPDWVFLPFVLDNHRDHFRIGSALNALCRRHPCFPTLLFYEVWCPLPATHVVDITAVIDSKLNALSCHKTALQCGDYLHASRGLAAYRSLYLPRSGRPGYAEAFWVEQAAGSGGILSLFLELRRRWLARLG